MSFSTLSGLVAVAVAVWLLATTDDGDPWWWRAVFATLLGAQAFTLGVRAPLSDLGEVLVSVAHLALVVLLAAFLAGATLTRRGNR